MKTSDIKALPEGTELFYCRTNGWNTGSGSSGSRVTVVDATVGHWGWDLTAKEWVRKTHAIKYGRYNIRRTDHGILVKLANGLIDVVAPGHIRGVYDTCQRELTELRELNARVANRKQDERIRQDGIRKAITAEFGIRVTTNNGYDGRTSASCVVNAEELLNLLRDLQKGAQG